MKESQNIKVSCIPPKGNSWFFEDIEYTSLKDALCECNAPMFSSVCCEVVITFPVCLVRNAVVKIPL